MIEKNRAVDTPPRSHVQIHCVMELGQGLLERFDTGAPIRNPQIAIHLIGWCPTTGFVIDLENLKQLK